MSLVDKTWMIHLMPGLLSILPCFSSSLRAITFWSHCSDTVTNICCIAKQKIVTDKSNSHKMVHIAIQHQHNDKMNEAPAAHHSKYMTNNCTGHYNSLDDCITCTYIWHIITCTIIRLKAEQNPCANQTEWNKTSSCLCCKLFLT